MGATMKTIPLTETMAEFVKRVMLKHNLNGRRLAKKSGLSEAFIYSILIRRVSWVSALHYQKLENYLLALEEKKIEKTRNVGSANVKTDLSGNSDPTMRFVKDLYKFLENVKVLAEDWRQTLIKDYPELMKNEIQ